MSPSVARPARLVAVAIGLAIVAMLGSGATAQTRSLGRAESFAVLAGATVTNVGTTLITGDLGVFPGAAVTGNPQVNGEIHAGDAVAGGAQTDARATYTTLAALPCTQTLSGIVGNLTLTPGVYCFTSDALLTGTLTLDFQGNPDAEFVFKVGTQLTTASGSTIALINSPNPCNVFWQVGSSAVLGTNSVFVGTVIADQSITAATGARITGRLLALVGQVSLDSNTVTRPTCAIPPTTTSSTSTTVVGPTTTSSTSTTLVGPTTTSSTSTTLVPPPTTTTSSTSTTLVGPTTTSSTSTTLPGVTTTTPATSTTLVAPTTTRPSTTTTRPSTTTTSSTTPPVPPVTTTTSTLAPVTTTTTVPSPGVAAPEDGGGGTPTTAGQRERTVRSASNALGSRSLPATGSPVQWEAFAGGVAVALGGLILLATRRRRESAAPAAPPAENR